MERDDPRQAGGATPGTEGADYADRLNDLQSKWWKKVIPVQAPYRWNMRRRLKGRTLDVGCGNGRNLETLGPGSVGVDHNAHLIEICRAKGLSAYTVNEFFADATVSAPATYDALLAAHLIEHMEVDEAVEVLASYLPLVREGGTIMLVTPQERGHASDPTHVRFADFATLESIADRLGLTVVGRYSFPFPRSFGRLFIYNEFNVVAQVSRSTGHSDAT